MVEAVAKRSNHSKRFAHPHVHYTVCDSLMRYAEFLGYGDIHTKIDEKNRLESNCCNS